MDMHSVKSTFANAAQSPTVKQAGHVSKRFGGWWSISIVAFIVVMVRAPQQGEVVLYKLMLVAVSIGVAYLADRSLFQYGPQLSTTEPRDTVLAARLVARAIVSYAVINGITSGL